jgi:hypothetical protein
MANEGSGEISAQDERRKSDRRAGEDRRKQDLGPPDGVERRKGERRSGRDRRADAAQAQQSK